MNKYIIFLFLILIMFERLLSAGSFISPIGVTDSDADNLEDEMSQERTITRNEKPVDYMTFMMTLYNLNLNR